MIVARSVPTLPTNALNEMESKAGDPRGPRFGLAVKRLRRERDWSQREFAERAGMERSYLGKVERGEQSPTIRVVFRIADALGVEPAVLFD